jgi:transcriptional regulatory protein LevR
VKCTCFAADVRRLEQGLEPQHYDAFLLFAEEDQDFAMQILDRMEAEYGLKVPKQEYVLLTISFWFRHGLIIQIVRAHRVKICVRCLDIK